MAELARILWYTGWAIVTHTQIVPWKTCDCLPHPKTLKNEPKFSSPRFSLEINEFIEFACRVWVRGYWEECGWPPKQPYWKVCIQHGWMMASHDCIGGVPPPSLLQSVLWPITEPTRPHAHRIELRASDKKSGQMLERVSWLSDSPHLLTLVENVSSPHDRLSELGTEDHGSSLAQRITHCRRSL